MREATTGKRRPVATILGAADAEDIGERKPLPCEIEVCFAVCFPRSQPTAYDSYMHQNPRYRPPCGLRATGPPVGTCWVLCGLLFFMRPSHDHKPISAAITTKPRGHTAGCAAAVPPATTLSSFSPAPPRCSSLSQRSAFPCSHSFREGGKGACGMPRARR